jgi:hypothetical protein
MVNFRGHGFGCGKRSSPVLRVAQLDMEGRVEGGQKTTDPIDVANRWIAAYNAKDFETLRSLMTDDIHVEHHNRGFVLNGPDAVLEVITRFAGMVPDRRLHSARRQFSDGQRVVTELTWEATPILPRA